MSLLALCCAIRTCASGVPREPLMIVAAATRPTVDMPMLPADGALIGPIQRVLVVSVSTLPAMRVTVLTILM